MSKVSISMSSDMSKKAGALSCTTCLKHLGVNVSADSMKTIVEGKSHPEFRESGTSIDGTIEVLVPPGKQRKIAVLGAYMDFTTDETVKFYYASKTVDIEGAEVTLNMNIDYLGDFEHANLVGRYLTGTNTGPTGFVNVKVSPFKGADDFIMQKQPIINGWFDFMASTNFPMTYTLENGSDLFTDVTTDDFATSNHVVHVERPDHYEFRGTWEFSKMQNIVYGFFGPAVSSEVVCRQPTGTTALNNMSTSSAGPSDMSFVVNGVLASNTILLEGGVENGTGLCISPTLVTQRYSSNRIDIDHFQHAGLGNDNAKSIEGSFTYIGTSSSDFTKYRAAGNTFSFRTLPGTFVAGGFDGLRLFSKNGAITSKELTCDATALSAEGFTEEALALGGSKVSGSEAIFSLTAAPNASYKYYICPSIGGALQKYGGLFISPLQGKQYSQSAYIKAVNADPSDLFGYRVAMSGNTVAVTAKQEASNQITITNGSAASANNANSNAGAVYVYLKSPSWAQEAYIKASNSEASDFFGLAIDIDADTLVVGAPNEDSNQLTIINGPSSSSDNSSTDSGAVYVYKRTGATWVQEAYIKAPNAGASDFFGTSVAISGDTLVVGAKGESSSQNTITNGSTASADDAAIASGAVYVFKRTGATWVQEAYIKAPNVGGGDNFGTSVDIQGDTIVASSLFEDSNQASITNGSTANSDDSLSNSGAVYIFKRTGTNWAQESFIKPSNSTTSLNFGYDVAISGNSIAVSATQESSSQNFISHGTTASPSVGLTFSGAVYVFSRDGVNWSQEAYIKASNATASAAFGSSLAFYKDRLVVGATNESSAQTSPIAGINSSNDTTASGAGAVYVYQRYGSYWSPINYIKSSNMEAGDILGQDVAIDGSVIAVGAFSEDSNQVTITNGSMASPDNSSGNSGAVYVFTEN
ncbi:FG-GAP repeat protein [bacterium]|nr:FG-GAP repeat protein [bacterium]